MEFGFHFPTKIRFGRGAVQNNGAALRLGERAFIVTGKHSGRASGALADVIAALTHQKIECSVFEGIGNQYVLIALAFFLLGIPAGLGVDRLVRWWKKRRIERYAQKWMGRENASHLPSEH